ncbi:Ig-like domain-containing protein [Polyangium sp. 15x6]|uniref:Ig-like domain-containing protein n=1 Tax=Polyangium sp. 15x6 TaxID=3042687 RepID=UPI00249B5F74|nr:Ig-like domain-containing protein [Polyangium sp. 15x6]MDI3288902.1 Ig-like domain-containing protein [Polyangium sp. 15x6]
MRYRSLALLVPFALAACGSESDPSKPTAGAPASIILELARQDGPAPYPIEVTARVTSIDGKPVSGLSVEITAEGGTAGAASETAAGVYRSTVKPSLAAGDAGEVLVRAKVAELSADATAVVLPVVDAAWGQPERVPGLVNTAGTEDSAEVSPDGEWLIVSSYSPVDLLCCIAGKDLPGCTGEAASPAAPECNATHGPSAAPERPDMPGAARILSPTEIDHTIPQLGVTEALFALPPVAAYGFRRQGDGSFGEPFVIAIDMNGFTYSPFGFTYLGAPKDGAASVLFAFDPLHGPDTAPDLYHADVTLGAPVSLGKYSFENNFLIADPFPVTQLPLVPLDQFHSNPSFGHGHVWFDTEGPVQKDLFVAKPSGALPGATFSETVVAAISKPDVEEFQPFVDEAASKLYFSRGFRDISTSAYSGGDPALPASFGDPVVEIGLDAPPDGPGDIVSIGEPSVARTADGEEWLYFVYYVRREGHYDGSVGRVRKR